MGKAHKFVMPCVRCGVPRQVNQARKPRPCSDCWGGMNAYEKKVWAT